MNSENVTHMSLARLAELIAAAVMDSADRAGIEFHLDDGTPEEQQLLKAMIVRKVPQLDPEQADLVASQVLDQVRYQTAERRKAASMGPGGHA